MRGAAVALLGSLVGGGLGFAFSVVMARALDQSEFGLLVLALSLLTAASTVTVAGADLATVRFVAAAVGAGAKRGALVTPLAVVAVITLVVSIVVLVLAGPIAQHLLDRPEFASPLRALALALPLTVLAQMLSAGVSGLERASGELVRKAAEQGGRIVLGPLAVALGLGLTGVVLGLAAAAAVAAVLVGILLLRALPRGGPVERVPTRDVLGFIWPQAVASGSVQLWELAKVLILAAATGSRTVALYGAAFALARLPALVYNSFAYRFAPAISRLWSEGERAQLQQLLRSVTRWIALLCAPLYAGAIALAVPLLLVYGDEYGDAGLALILIAAGSMINSTAGPVEMTLIMTGNVRMEMLTNVVGVVVLVPAAFVLIPRYELIGAALMGLLWAILINVLKSVFVWRRLGMTTLGPGLIGPLAAAGVAGAAAAALHAATDLGQSLPGALLLGLLLVALYLVLLWRASGLTADDRRVLRMAIRT